MAERQKWIITGGCGFVGSNLAATLLGKGHEVVVLDNLRRLGAAKNLEWLRKLGGKLTFLPTDTRARSDVDAAFSAHPGGVTAVAHLAGQVAMTTSLENPRLDFETNALGAINVLEAVRSYCKDAVVMFSSTNKVYGDLGSVRLREGATRWETPEHPNGFDETLPLSFESPYGCSKGAADQYFLDYARMFDLKTLVFRHSSIYGGRQFPTFDQGWVGWFCLQGIRQAREAAAGRPPTPFTVSGDGKQVRDLLHADDIVACYIAGLSARRFGVAMNIGGGALNSLSVLELLTLVGELVGTRLSFTHLPFRRSDQKVFVANNRLAGELLGWAPRVTAREGVQRMVSWMREAEQDIVTS